MQQRRRAESLVAFKQGNLGRAITLADQALSDGDSYVWALRLRLAAKRYEGAVRLGERSLDKHPGIAGMVGQAYEGLGDFANAQAYYAKACQNEPDNPEWPYLNAVVLSRLFRDFEAMESLRAHVALAPEPWVTLRLADYELVFGDPEAALGLADQVTGSSWADLVAGHSLCALRRFSEAEDRFERALKTADDPIEVRYRWALALLSAGEIPRGLDRLREVLSLRSTYAQAYGQLVRAAKVTEADAPLVEAMESLREEASGADLITLNYALGKAYEDTGRYERAIEAFDEANRLRTETNQQGYRSEVYEAQINFRKKAYSVGAVEGAFETEEPLFIVGMIRSGTTFAEQILSSHPQVAGAGELDYWIKSEARLTDSGKTGLNADVLREAAGVYLRLLRRYARPGTTRIVDKQPGNLLLVGALHAIFPNARFVFMRRNPMDVAISIWTTPMSTSVGFVNDRANLAQAIRVHEALMQHWQAVIPADRFRVVQYEDLVENPEGQLRGLLEFCGLPWDDRVLAPEDNARTVATPSFWQVRQPVYRSSVGRWRHYEPWLEEFASLADLPEVGP